MYLAAYVFGHYDQLTVEDAEKLDLINIAFGLIRDGVLFVPENVKNPVWDRMRTVNPSLRILLSIGGWGAGGFSTMARTAEGLSRFIDSCMAAVAEYSLDGLDLDWEYPTIDSAGIDADPSDKENFTLLLTELRAALDAHFPHVHKMLTIAAGGGDYYIEAVEIAKIVPVLDYISLMTYDLAGTWSNAIHHTALYPCTAQQNSVHTNVARFMAAGAPAHKLVIGAAFYSRRWLRIPDGGTHGLGQPSVISDPNSGSFGPDFGTLSAMRGHDGYTVFHDKTAHAPYLYNAENGEWISYNDEESVADKVRYAREKGLCGVMYWEHSCDPTRALLSAMHRAKNEV